MKKKYASPKLKQRAYMERKKVRQEEDAEATSDRDQCAKFDLRFFGESAHNRNAESVSAEIHIHRQFLRAIPGQPDVLPGETLRQLAQRTWNSYIGISDDVGGEWVDGKWIESDDRWVPLFNPNNQSFDGGPRWQGYTVPGGVRYFEYWQPPADCQNGEADRPIDISVLPKLPPAPITRKPELKPVPSVPVTVDAPLITGYETPQFSGFGTFGVSKTSHV